MKPCSQRVQGVDVRLALSEQTLPTIIEEIVQPFYAQVVADREAGRFVADASMLHHLKIRQSVFLIRFLTQPLEAMMPMIKSSGAVHGRIRLDFGIFSRYFLLYSDLVLAWLARRGVEGDRLALWQAKLFALFGAMACTYGGPEAQERVAAAIKPKIESVVDSERLKAMHPPQSEKIDAARFVAESGGLDSDLVAELKELEEDARGAIDLEGALSGKLRGVLVALLGTYARALNNTLEFQDLGYALESLAGLIERVDEIESPDRAKRVLAFLEAVIGDLGQWRQEVFVAQSAQDIHYLDASLFSSCAQLETLLLPGESSGEEEQELELF